MPRNLSLAGQRTLPTYVFSLAVLQRHTAVMTFTGSGSSNKERECERNRRESDGRWAQATVCTSHYTCVYGAHLQYVQVYA